MRRLYLSLDWNRNRGIMQGNSRLYWIYQLLLVYNLKKESQKTCKIKYNPLNSKEPKNVFLMIVNFLFRFNSSISLMNAEKLFFVQHKNFLLTNLILCIFARVKAAGRLLHILFVLLYKFRRYVLVMIVLFHRRTGVETSKPSILSVFSNKKYLSSVCPKAKYIQLAWLCFLWHIG